jgi:hypothetical protein
VAGTAVVAREAYPDHTAWDPRDDHYDAKASPANPIWQMVDIRLEEIFHQAVPIGALRGVPALKKMELLRKGSRLSVQPVTAQEFAAVLQLGRGASGGAPRVKAGNETRATTKRPPMTKQAAAARARKSTRGAKTSGKARR